MPYVFFKDTIQTPYFGYIFGAVLVIVWRYIFRDRNYCCIVMVMPILIIGFVGTIAKLCAMEMDLFLIDQNAHPRYDIYYDTLADAHSAVRVYFPLWFISQRCLIPFANGSVNYCIFTAVLGVLSIIGSFLQRHFWGIKVCGRWRIRMTLFSMLLILVMFLVDRYYNILPSIFLPQNVEDKSSTIILSNGNILESHGVDLGYSNTPIFFQSYECAIDNPIALYEFPYRDSPIVSFIQKITLADITEAISVRGWMIMSNGEGVHGFVNISDLIKSFRSNCSLGDYFVFRTWMLSANITAYITNNRRVFSDMMRSYVPFEFIVIIPPIIYFIWKFVSEYFAKVKHKHIPW